MGQKSKNPYPLRYHIIPNSAMAWALKLTQPVTSWFLGPDSCLVENYAISKWVWVLAIMLTTLCSICKSQSDKSDGGLISQKVVLVQRFFRANPSREILTFYRTTVRSCFYNTNAIFEKKINPLNKCYKIQ